jgi:universal stress protein E
MRSIRRILVAVKEPGSRSMPATVTKGMQLARALGAQLELFHALTAPVYAEVFIYGKRSFGDVTQQIRLRAVKRLQALAARASAAGRQRQVRISVAAEWDAPAYEAIIRRAMATKADLIIAERHAGRHIAASLLHLNDWELLRRSPVPVLLVKTAGRYQHASILAAIDPAHRMAKPVRLDREILSISSVMAAALAGRLHAVHAYQSVASGQRPTDALDPGTAARINAELATAARDRFQRALAGVTVARSRRLLMDLPPPEAIVQAAGSVRSDIVVMGAVSRSGLRRWIVGNTAESVLDRLSCDLLIVKPPRFASGIGRRRSGARLVPVLVPVP